MNPILCVTEFTDRTIEAARVAAAFAARWGGRVVLVRSVDEREQFPFALRQRLVEQDWPKLRAEAQQLRAHGFDFEEEVLRGMPEDGVAGFAWNTRAQLIVVACEPTGVLDHWALGCLAEEIATTSLVPVLAVRSAAALERWLAGTGALTVFASVDPAERADAMLNRLDELRALGRCALSASFATYPEVSHSRTGPPATLRREAGAEPTLAAEIAQQLEARDIRLSRIAETRHVDAAIVDRAAQAGADLLVVTSHPRDEPGLLPHRCVVGGVLRRAPMNVLCVPEPDIEPARLAVAAHAGEAESHS